MRTPQCVHSTFCVMTSPDIALHAITVKKSGLNSSSMATVVNMDGALVSPDRATVSVFDRGFLYGDSVYEVIRTYGRRPFEVDRHLARLERSAARLGLALPWDAARTRAEIVRTLEACGDGGAPDPEVAPWNAGELSLRVIMTRGAGELGLDPALAVDPRAIVIASPLRAPPLG